MVSSFADGEDYICFRGRNLFIGYFSNAEQSAKTVDDKSFIHSGAIGRGDDWFITITELENYLSGTAAG